MNDQIILENYLLILKSNVEVFVHGTLESSYDNNQKKLKACLDDTIESQRKTYCLMVKNKMYTVEKTTIPLIKTCLKKITKKS